MEPNQFKKFPKKKKLPTRLSSWIIEAVKDAKKLSETPGFVLDMGKFNTMSNDGCHVCLGGAAIVGCGLVSPGAGTNVFSSNVDPLRQTPYRVASALDFVRSGMLKNALERLGFSLPLGQKLDVFNQLEQSMKEKYKQACRSGVARLEWKDYIDAAKKLDEIGL